jgi:hypothetical protein
MHLNCLTRSDPVYVDVTFPKQKKIAQTNKRTHKSRLWGIDKGLAPRSWRDPGRGSWAWTQLNLGGRTNNQHRRRAREGGRHSNRARELTLCRVPLYIHPGFPRPTKSHGFWEAAADVTAAAAALQAGAGAVGGMLLRFAEPADTRRGRRWSSGHARKKPRTGAIVSDTVRLTGPTKHTAYQSFTWARQPSQACDSVGPYWWE